MEMVEKVYDPETKKNIDYTVTVNNLYYEPLKKLEKLLQEFDESIRLNVTGNYKLTLESGSLFSDSVRYSFEEDGVGRIVTISGDIKRNPISCKEQS